MRQISAMGSQEGDKSGDEKIEKSCGEGKEGRNTGRRRRVIDSSACPACVKLTLRA